MVVSSLYVNIYLFLSKLLCVCKACMCHGVTWVEDPSGRKDEKILVGDQSIHLCVCK